MRAAIVVTPISNDKILSSSNPKSGSTDTKGTGRSNDSSADSTSTTAASGINKAADDTVNVDRASQLYRSAVSEPVKSTGNINTAEEAGQLVARISQQLMADGAQAMQAQTGNLANQAGSLLSTAP